MTITEATPSTTIETPPNPAEAIERFTAIISRTGTNLKVDDPPRLIVIPSVPLWARGEMAGRA